MNFLKKYFIVPTKPPVRIVRRIKKQTGNSKRIFIGLSRQGIVAAERTIQHPRNRAGAHFTASLIAGSILIGLGVSFFVHGRLGVPAYDVLFTGIQKQLGISLGQASWLFSALLFVCSALLGYRPRLNGLLFIFVNGIAVDIFVKIIKDATVLPLQIAFLFIGITAIAAGVSLVLHAGLTGGPVELLMLAAQERGTDPYRMRVCLEISVVILGILLGGDMSFGTVFAVVMLSPAIRTIQQALADHRQGRTLRTADPEQRFAIAQGDVC